LRPYDRGARGGEIRPGPKQLVQLTNFRRQDTFAGFLTRDRKRAFFVASADPDRMDPYGNCKLFSVDVHGGVPRQITHLDPGFRVPAPGCFLPTGIGYGLHRFVAQDPVTGTIVFDSTLDVFKLRPGTSAVYGGLDQIFAIRPMGMGFAS
jgi:hypothetical protein